jgi:hypothetical protein
MRPNSIKVRLKFYSERLNSIVAEISVVTHFESAVLLTF